MDRRKFNKSILASIQLAENLGLKPQTIQPSSLSNSSQLRTLADEGATYLSYYHETVDLRHLNFFVGDGDILQFSFFEQRRAFSLRYAFFGSPYRLLSKSNGIQAVVPMAETAQKSGGPLHDDIADPATFEGDILIEGQEGFVDDESAGSEIDGAGLALRYEYAEDEYRRLVHPCAHLHVGWQREGRIPVRRVWTPELFTSFVFRNMFADAWFSSRDSNVAEMDGYMAEIGLQREKLKANQVDASFFHDFESCVLFID